MDMQNIKRWKNEREQSRNERRTCETGDVHFGQVPRLQNHDGEPIRCRLVAERDQQLSSNLVSDLFKGLTRVAHNFGLIHFGNS